MNRERNLVVDIMKGIAIVCVVVGHLYHTGNWIYSWHMPLFFFLSGFFFRQTSFSSVIKRGFRSLLLPYLITAAFFVTYAVVYDLTHGTRLWPSYLLRALWANGSINHTSKFFSDIQIIGAIWFLPALFWCKVIYNVLASRFIGKRLTALIIIIMMSAVAIDRLLINFPFAVLPGVSAMIFYHIGRICKEHQNEVMSTKVTYFFVPFFLVASMYSSLGVASCRYAVPPLDIIGVLGGIFVVFKISQLFARIPVVKMLFCVLGKNSLFVLCMHSILRRIPILQNNITILQLLIPIVFAFFIEGFLFFKERLRLIIEL